MGRWLDRYNKKPDRAGEIVQSARAYGAGQALGREFGESMESYTKRRPNVAKGLKEAHDDIREIQRRSGKSW